MKGFDEAETIKAIPRVLPLHMRKVNQNSWLTGVGLAVIFSVEWHDNKRWMHLSASRRSRLPTYDDLVWAKKLFIGDRKAIQVFAPKAEHVNYSAYVLHLWACLDGDGLPDFRVEGMI